MQPISLILPARYRTIPRAFTISLPFTGVSSDRSTVNFGFNAYYFLTTLTASDSCLPGSAINLPITLSSIRSYYYIRFMRTPAFVIC